MKRSTLTAWLVTVCLLGACGGTDNPSSGDERDGAFEPMTRTLDDAEKVEEQVLRQKEQVDEALRRMEGGDDEPDA